MDDALSIHLDDYLTNPFIEKLNLDKKDLIMVRIYI